MRECWINVYCRKRVYSYGAHFKSKEAVELATARIWLKPIYRIHVKMKQPESLYIQTFGRGKRAQ
jgi:hypothetical protein